MGGNGYANITRPLPEPPEEPKPARVQVHEPAPRYESIEEKRFYEHPEQQRRKDEGLVDWAERVQAAATAAGFVGVRREAPQRPSPPLKPVPKDNWLPFREPGDDD